MARRVAAALAAVTADWVAVGELGSGVALERPVIADAVPGAGPLAGLLAALEHAGGRAVLVVACDLPFADSRLLGDLVDRGEAGGCDAVVPSEGGRAQPLCAWYSAACREPLRAALASGERGVLRFVASLEVASLAVAAAPDGAPSRLTNVNTPADYERALAQLGRGVPVR